MTADARRRWLVLSALGVAVVGLHVATLLALGPAWLDPPEPPALAAPPRIELRSVVLPAQASPPSPTAEAAAPAGRARAQPTAAAAAPRVRGASSPTAVAVDPEPRAAAPARASTRTVTAQAAQPATTVVDIPVYASRLPPAGRWRYRLQRGLVVGEAELNWAPQADARYELHLQGRVAGVNLLEWASQGQLDAAGVAPERFAVRRRGRDRQAANFQREAGKITFSGPTHEQPLLPGAQDRLSWMLQLPAIVAAAPERFAAGATVVLFVAGARGDADVWTFVVQGVEALGDRAALKLVREPRRPYDTRVEVWLDPAEHHLPLRVVQTPSAGGPALELQREPESR